MNHSHPSCSAYGRRPRAERRTPGKQPGVNPEVSGGGGYPEEPPLGVALCEKDSTPRTSQGLGGRKSESGRSRTTATGQLWRWGVADLETLDSATYVLKIYRDKLRWPRPLTVRLFHRTHAHLADEVVPMSLFERE